MAHIDIELTLLSVSQMDENPALFSVSSIKCRLAHCPHSLSSFGQFGHRDALKAEITTLVQIRLLTDFLCSQKHSKVSFELPEGFSVTAEKWQQQGMFRVTRNLSGYSESLAAGLPLRSRATCSNLVVFLVYSLYFMPYNLILLYSVVRPMPSNAAANLRLPFACSKARIICFFSISTFFRDNDASPDN